MFELILIRLLFGNATPSRGDEPTISVSSSVMYGTVDVVGKVNVDFIYELPQQGTESSLILLRDPDEEKLVEGIALGLGMRKVGFIFTQSVGQGKMDYTLSNREVLQAVEVQSESDLKEWVTVLVKLEVNEEGGADVHFEAFQMSDLCVKLFKEDWFDKEIKDEDDTKLSKMKKEVVVGGKDTKDHTKVSKMKKEVVVGGKDTNEVDNDFFFVVVKIFDHQANGFKKQGTKMKRKMWIQNMKIKLIVWGIILLLILVVFMSIRNRLRCF